MASTTVVERAREPWFPQILSAATKGVLAVLGQGLFAGANFLVSVLLARWLAPNQYGAFALAYSGFLLFLMLYSACVYEPLIVFGSGRYANQLQDYLGLLIRGNILVLIAVSGLMLVTSFLLSLLFPSEVARDFLALSLAAPLVLVTWLGRGGFYAQLKPGKVAWGGMFYFLTLLAALILLRRYGHLSGSSAFLAMGVAGLVSNLFLFSRLGFRFRSNPGALTLHEVADGHWAYGRWALAAAVVSWFPQNVYYAALPARTGLEGAAALRALTNLISPILQTLTALAAVLIPVLVNRHQQGGIAKMRKTMRTLVVLLIPGSFLYFAVLWLCRSFLLQLLYSGKYQPYSGWPLLFVALVPVAATTAMIVSSALRALQKPECIFWSYAAATATAIGLGLPLTVYCGLSGATIALLISSSVAVLVMIWFFRRSAAEEAEAFV